MKWGGAVVSVVLLVVWVGSGWSWMSWGDTGGLSANVWRGQFFIKREGIPAPHQNLGFGFVRTGPFRLIWGYYMGRSPVGWVVTIPVWALSGPVTIATAAAWRLDALPRRRARAGLCPKCGYNRTGLAPGAVCPECGSAASVAGALS